jgi:UDP-glucuronate 4-epimerase
MKDKVIITGSSGFIGSNLVDRLSQMYRIIAIDREEPPHNVQSLSHEVYIQDINDPLPDIEGVEGVVHLAARAGVRQSNKEFSSYVEDNIIGTKSILDKCIKDWKPDRCIITSSSSVYGDNFPEPNRPKSPYALTKYVNEKMLQMYQDLGLVSYKNYTVIRPFTVYGPRQRDDLAIQRFIKWAIEDKPLIIYGDGYQERDFTYIDDICYSIERLLNPGSGPYFHGGYDIGSGNSYKLFDVVRLISKILGKELRLLFDEPNIYDVRKTKANCGNLYDSTGYIPDTNIEDGLRKQIEWAEDVLS